MDQRSGNGWISGWSQIFVFYQRNSWTRLWVAWRENCSSALNKIIQNTRFKKRVSLGEMKAHEEDRFLRGRQIAYLIYENFRVTGANDSVENYADLFTIVLRNDDMQEFDSMTKIPSDDILESFYKLTIRESDKPDYHRLTTMVKRRIEQNLRMMNFEARNGNCERNAVVKNSGTKQREQTSLENCWKWQANGQCSKGGNCSFRHDTNKRAKSTQPNPSPGSSTQQSVKDASRTRSPRGKSPSGKMAWLPLHNSILWKMASSGVLVLQVRSRMQIWGKSALMRNARLTNSLARSFKRMVTKVQWLYWRKHDNWVAYFRIWSRRSLQRFCGRAQTQWSQSDVFDSLQPC